jgi:hypothetical protein
MTAINFLQMIKTQSNQINTLRVVTMFWINGKTNSLKVFYILNMQRLTTFFGN